MPPPKIPTDVSQLVTTHITSVEQLEILLWLRANSSQDAEASVIARELRTSDSSVELRLDELCSGGLVAKSPDGRYRYAPQDARQANTVDALAMTYQQARFAVMNLIYSKPIDKIRTFADAFRFTKDKG